jgi:hypothetical protein
MQGVSFLTSLLFLGTTFAGLEAIFGLLRSAGQTTPLSHLRSLVYSPPYHKHRDGILERITQAYGRHHALLITGRMVANELDLIDGCDRRPSLVISRKEGSLFLALTIQTSQGRAEVRTCGQRCPRGR